MAIKIWEYQWRQSGECSATDYFLFPDFKSDLDFLDVFLKDEELFFDFNEEVELFNEEDELLREEDELLREEAILDREVREFFLMTFTFSFSRDLLMTFPKISPGDPSEVRFSLSFSDKDCRSASGKGCNSVSDSDDCPIGSGRRPRWSSSNFLNGFFTIFKLLFKHCNHCLLSCSSTAINVWDCPLLPSKNPTRKTFFAAKK